MLLFSTQSLLKLSKLVSLFYLEIPNDLHLMQNKKKSLSFTCKVTCLLWSLFLLTFRSTLSFSYKGFLSHLWTCQNYSTHRFFVLDTPSIWNAFSSYICMACFFSALPFSARTRLATPSNRHCGLTITVFCSYHLLLSIIYNYITVYLCIFLFYCLFPPLEWLAEDHENKTAFLVYPPIYLSHSSSHFRRCLCSTNICCYLLGLEKIWVEIETGMETSSGVGEWGIWRSRYRIWEILVEKRMEERILRCVTAVCKLVPFQHF